MSEFGSLSRLDAVSRPGAGDAPPGPSSFAGGNVTRPVPTLAISPWWEQPLPSSQFIYQDTLNTTGAAQSVAAGASDVLLIGSEYQVPSTFRGVITGFALLVQASLATDNFYFTFKRNGGPIQGLDRLRTFPIASNGVVREFGGYAIRLQQGDRVAVAVTNPGLAAVLVTVSYLGWIAASAEIERIEGNLTV